MKRETRLTATTALMDPVVLVPITVEDLAAFGGFTLVIAAAPGGAAPGSTAAGLRAGGVPFFARLAIVYSPAVALAGAD